jgi:exonuclease III
VGKFLRTRPNTFYQAKDPMDEKDWLKSVEKKLEIVQCTDREKVLFVTLQLLGTAADWLETYRNIHTNVKAITWNEFKACFMTHYQGKRISKLKIGFLNLPRLWKFVEGDFGGILT